MIHEWAAFVVAMIFYLLAALYYARAALNDAGAVRRFSFMLRKLTAIGLGVTAIDADPVAVWVFVAYVAAAILSWALLAARETRNGAKRVGFARILAD